MELIKELLNSFMITFIKKLSLTIKKEGIVYEFN